MDDSQKSFVAQKTLNGKLHHFCIARLNLLMLTAYIRTRSKEVLFGNQCLLVLPTAGKFSKYDDLFGPLLPIFGLIITAILILISLMLNTIQMAAIKITT